jgi:transcriptional regulator with XRE-family HTH domain
MSQEKLGQLLGLTFQQVQKYERGVNRISAGRLFEVARVLGVPISFFYEGLSAPASVALTNPALIQSFSPPGQSHQLGMAFTRIRDARLRRHLLGLVESLAVSDAGE